MTAEAPPGAGGFDLARFLAAQDAHGTYTTATAELRAGGKRSHAYARHEVLGGRLRECTEIMLGLADGPSAEEVLGSIDAVKLRSSMTLFANADPAEERFRAVLDRYFDGHRDELTERLLAGRA